MAPQVSKLILLVMAIMFGTTQAQYIRGGNQPETPIQDNDGDTSKSPTTEDAKEEDAVEDNLPVMGKRESSDADIKLIAENEGWGFEDTAALMDLQHEFNALVSHLERNENFADSVMAWKPGDSVSIYFKNGLPGEVEKEVDLFSRSNRVDVKKIATKFSLKEQEERAENISKLLEEKGFFNVNYSLGPGDGLVFEVSPPEDSKLADTPTPETDQDEDLHDLGHVDSNVMDSVALDVLGEEVGKKMLYGVRLIVSREEQAEDLHTYGGRQIRSSNSQCTTGFTVIKSNGVTGVATAAHCTGMNTYDAVPPEGDYGTSFQSQHNGAYGDFEWHTTPHIEPPRYYARPGELRWVTSIDTSFSKNNWVCGYSRMKARRYCDRIYRTNVRQGGTRRLIAMRNQNMTGGDSGGPWSWGTQAAGLVKGWKWIWFKRRDTWSRASYLPLGLPGVVVQTI